MSRAHSKSIFENWSAPAKGFLALVGLVGGLITLANAQTEESAAIQAKRKQRDATVWKAEAAAEAYGESIVKFWDSLREAESPLRVFRTFPWGLLKSRIGPLIRGIPRVFSNLSIKRHDPEFSFSKAISCKRWLTISSSKGMS